jgi:hypothetical protein
VRPAANRLGGATQQLGDVVLAAARQFLGFDGRIEAATLFRQLGENAFHGLCDGLGIRKQQAGGLLV